MSNRLMDVNEVAEQLGISRSYAYKVIKRLNTELEQRGCLVVQGKVSRDYFEQRYFGKPSLTPQEGGSDDGQ